MADERLSFDIDSPWKGEHFYRYLEILKNIKPTDNVLDIACGEGYGTYQIANHTNGNVYGGDISNEAVAECNKTYVKKNLAYEQMDGTNLEFDSSFFDVVVSFETIEHTTEYMAMLNELNRVAKDDSYIFISTPNIVINSPSGSVHNPYHTQEWTYEELKEILNSVFDNVLILGQKYSRFDKASALNVGKIFEFVFTQRLIRKLPLSLKNKISNFVNNKPFYPQTDDFTLVDNIQDILQCQTFFCICRKRAN